MLITASSASIETSRSMFPVSQARTKRATTSASFLLQIRARRDGISRARDALALKGAVDRRHRRLQHLRHVGGAPIKDVVQDQCGALAGRQYLHRADEGQPDTLAKQKRGFGAGAL